MMKFEEFSVPFCLKTEYMKEVHSHLDCVVDDLVRDVEIWLEEMVELYINGYFERAAALYEKIMDHILLPYRESSGDSLFLRAILQCYAFFSKSLIEDDIDIYVYEEILSHIFKLDEEPLKKYMFIQLYRAINSYRNNVEILLDFIDATLRVGIVFVPAITNESAENVCCI